MMAGAGASPYELASDAASRLGIAVGAEELATLASDLDLGDGEMAAVAATFSYLAEKRRLASIETQLRLSRLPRPRSALLRRLPARRIRLAVHQQPEHQHGHAERQPSGAGQAQRHRGAYQRARAVPIPMAVDQLLAQDPAIRLVR